ncbi:MAG: FAD-dependent oxidoreductase [Opitutaceae bacterium]|nr:FAD-dependent oxidoreductase [Opitutaceae bacterium]
MTSSPPPSPYDLVVVGATPSGIVCAIRAAREGLCVLLVNPMRHVGGFMTSGAGGWEAPYDGARSPLYDETLRRISVYYRENYGEESPQYRASRPDPATRSRLGRPKVEPRVAELIFEQMLAAESRLTVLREYYPVSAEREGARLVAVTFQEMHGGRTLRVAGENFADCMYEGDLLAVAGVPWRVGREARSGYGEPHAGVIFTRDRAPGQSPHPRPPLNIRQMGASHGVEILLPESTGEADDAVMAYNYRLVLTKNPANRAMVTRPAGYDPAALGWHGRSIVPGLPNDKIAWNGGGRLIGPQHAWPTGDWKTREEIPRQYLDAAVGRLWFYQNDPAASGDDREFWKEYGLARDEFPDNGHLPYEVYVREARRIVGRYVFTEHDATFAPGIERTPVQTDSIAVTDWPLDSVACTDRPPRKGEVRREGAFIIADAWRPAQVPWRTLLPQGLDNLLVPVCLSATHVGWGTLRLEPVWMQTGEAAAHAVALAHRRGCAPALVDADELLRTLVQARVMVSFFNDVDVAASSDIAPAVQYFGTKGFFKTCDARPDAPLSGPLAQAWLTTVRALLRRDASFDPTTAARALPDDSGETAGEPVSLADFVGRLRNLRASFGLAPAPSLPVSGFGTPVSRGEACRFLFELLAGRPT